MDKLKVAEELVKVAKSLVASNDMYQKSLEKSLNAIRYTPVEYAWGFDGDKKYDEMREKRHAVIRLLEELIYEMPTPIKYVVVGLNGNRVLKYDNRKDFIEAMEKMNMTRTENHGKSGNKSLHGQPMFEELAGPMGSGKELRYETWEVNDQMSK